MTIFRDVFQIAYVTNDLEQAVQVMRDQYGCGDFVYFSGLPDALTDFALGYSGSTMFELMQPLLASGDFYSDHLGNAEGFALRHHHFGMLVETTEGVSAIRSAHVSLGHPIVYEGHMEGAVEYLYADCRASLGHYLEYIRLEDGGRQMFASVPGSPYA